MPKTTPARGPMESGRGTDWEVLSRHALRLAVAMGAPLPRAADIAQEALLRLLTANEIRQPKAWLRTVVRRLLYKARQERAPESLDAVDEGSLSCGSTRPDLPLQTRRVLTELRGSDRRILLMTLAGFKQREIGRRMGWSERSVGSRVSRAQARARALRDRGPL